MPTEDKDIAVYYYLLKNAGRTLLFVNSIKTARRIDGLLRALGINCRTIHAQLQQRQRMRALESFRSSPIAVLVATDVAARGLDIPKITTVLHYDIARSTQVYTHRSGRTARAGQAGTSVAFVSPEDATFHDLICRAQHLHNLSVYKMDPSAIPILKQRVSLAKRIFTLSFVAGSQVKEKNWLLQTAKEADLVFDEYMRVEEGLDVDDEEGGGGKGGKGGKGGGGGGGGGSGKEEKEERVQVKMNAKDKKQLDTMKAQLNALLAVPLETVQATTSSRKRGFVVFAK